MMRPPSKLLSWLLPCAVLVVACALRFWQLGDVPWGVFPDEGVNGDDAVRAGLHWYYPRNYGREGLFVNLIAFATQVFGRTPFALRFVAALFGVLCVAGVYLLGREALQSRRAALIAAFLTAVSFWAINFSRVAFRGILLPAVLAFSFALLLRGVRTRSVAVTGAAGALFGLSLHTYAAARLAPLILPVVIAAWCLTEPRFLRRHWRHLTLFAVLATVVALPMLLEFAANHAALLGRAEQVSVFSSAVNGGDALGTLCRSVWLSVAKYFVIGDPSWRHNYPPYPILHPLVSLAFLVGLAWAAAAAGRQLVRRLRSAEARDSRLPALALLLSWFAVMLAPEFLTAEGLPHALRAIGTMPPVYLLAALPFAWLLRRAEKLARPPGRRMLIGAILGALLFVGAFNTVKYFGYWANSPLQANAFLASWRKIIVDMENLPPVINKYVLLNAGGVVTTGETPLTICTFRYLMNPRVRNLRYLHGPAELHPPFAAALLVRHEASVREFHELYPGGDLRFHPVEGFEGVGYWIYYYEGRTPRAPR